MLCFPLSWHPRLSKHIRVVSHYFVPMRSFSFEARNFCNSPSVFGSLPTAVVAGCNNISQPSITKSIRISPNSAYNEQSFTQATAAFFNSDRTARALLSIQSKVTVHTCQSMVGLLAASQSMHRTMSWLRSGNTRHYTPKATAFPLSVQATKGT